MYDTIDGLVLPLPLKLSLLIAPVNADPIVGAAGLVFIGSPSPTPPSGLWLLSSSSVGRRIPSAGWDPWLTEAALESDRDIVPAREFILAARRVKKLSLPTGCVGSKSSGAAGSTALKLKARLVCSGRSSASRRGSSVVTGSAGAVLTTFRNAPIS